MRVKTVFSTLLAGVALALVTVHESQPARAQAQPNQPALTLTITPDSFPENAGLAAATGTVTRNTSVAAALVVTLASNDTSEARVPATVTIPAGATAASFAVSAVMDNIVDGTRLLHIDASAPGFIAARVPISVTDVTPPALRVHIKDYIIRSSATTPATAHTGIVSRNTVLAEAKAQPLIVNLQSTNTAEVTVPATVTIPAGELSVEFPITVVDDKLVNGTQRFQVVATSPGFVEARTAMAALDSDKPALVMSANTSTFTVTSGLRAATVTISRNTSTRLPLVVSLSSTATQLATVAPTVTIPAGQASVTFPVAAVNNKNVKANSPAHIIATAPGFIKDEISFTVTP